MHAQFDTPSPPSAAHALLTNRGDGFSSPFTSLGMRPSIDPNVHTELALTPENLDPAVAQKLGGGLRTMLSPTDLLRDWIVKKSTNMV